MMKTADIKAARRWPGSIQVKNNGDLPGKGGTGRGSSEGGFGSGSDMSSR
jgi:hypothetical protein